MPSNTDATAETTSHKDACTSSTQLGDLIQRRSDASSLSPKLQLRHAAKVVHSVGQCTYPMTHARSGVCKVCAGDDAKMGIGHLGMQFHPKCRQECTLTMHAPA